MAFLILPGIFAGILPFYLGMLDPAHSSGSIYGIFPVVAGLILLLWCVREFYVSGKGTLAPWHPPRHLVSTGLYRHTRNPMYLAVLAINLGLAVFFESTWIFIYLVVLAIVFHLRVRFNEERWLLGQFGQEWVQYKSAVPRWLPRIKPFMSSATSTIPEKK